MIKNLVLYLNYLHVATLLCWCNS